MFSNSSVALSNSTFSGTHRALLPTAARPSVTNRKLRSFIRAEMTPTAAAEQAAVSVSASSPPSSGLPPLPERRIVLGVGGLSADYLATVSQFPKPNDKIRSTSATVQGGGNAGNSLTAAARLGLTPRLISKVADDSQGRGLLSELEADGVDVSYMVVSREGNSPFTYIIVDSQTNSRTCIHTPGYPEMVPQDLCPSSLSSALDGARILYLDGRLHETALVIAKEATQRNVPILLDAERKREGLDDLLQLAGYLICSENFPQAWTETSTVPRALLSILVRLPNIKFVIVTLGENGCIMLERSNVENISEHETDIDNLVQSLQDKKKTCASPTCVSSESLYIKANGIGSICGRLHLGTAERIPPSELVDTTGAGDAFIGAVLYAICAGMLPEKMLLFASTVAALGCRALGARAGLPLRTDNRLAPFLV